VVIAFIVFAETGLMVGFFLPGDSLLFVPVLQYQINCYASIGSTGSDFINLIILWILVSACGILGNMPVLVW